MELRIPITSHQFSSNLHVIVALPQEKEDSFNVFVSNGYDTPQTVKMMGEFLDCITVDFKGNAEPEFTRKYIGIPDPKPIFDSLIEIRDKTKIHVEITDLIVPQVGDSLEHAKKII